MEHKDDDYQAYRRNQRLKAHYGLTLEGYNALLESQGNCCAVCKRPHRKKADQPWPVDHNHVTGQVRGIICPRCNLLITILDDPVLLELALEYIKR